MSSAKNLPPRTRMADLFSQELKQWSDAGQALGHEHPNLARYLTRQAQNPDIERLLEGVAFMGAQMRARNEACAPALTQDLAAMMAPWVSRPLPAATLCAFMPDLKTAKDVTWVPQGTRLRAQGNQQDICFQTRAALAVLPIALGQVQWHSQAHGQAELTITLITSGTLSSEMLNTHGISLYFTGPYSEACSLAFAVTHHATQVTLASSGQGTTFTGQMDPVPWASQIPLTPSFAQEPPMAHGLSQLRDAAVLPEKFCFAHVRFPQRQDVAFLGSTLTLRISIAQAPTLPDHLGATPVRLHCVPALNLTVCDAMPIRHTVGQSSHVLRPDCQGAHAHAILAVDDVRATSEATGVCEALMPQHLAMGLGNVPLPRWYKHMPPPPEGGPHTLQVHQAADSPPTLHPTTLSIAVHGYQEEAAAELAPGSLNLDAPHLGRLTATNVVTTTAPLPAPDAHQARFALLTLTAQRGRTHLTQNDIQQQLRIMATASRPDSAQARREQRRHQAITDVAHTTTTRLWRGAQVLCLDVHITMDVSGFENIADAYAWTMCLDAVWADAQPVHGLQRVHLIDKVSGRRYALPIRSGQSIQGRSACALAGKP
jgi:type VI secretion system protein ImpG